MKVGVATPLHIGIVAVSVEGAALCYRTIVLESESLLGENNHPRITLDNLPHAPILDAMVAGDLSAVARSMATSIETLAGAGASFAVCPDNTVHIAMPFLGPTSIPLLPITHVVAAEARARGFARVGVLGTRMTMHSTLYPDALGEYGISAVTPTPEEQDIIDGAIWRELVRGRFTDSTRRAYQTVIDSLRARGCDSVALVCTEIPLLIAPSDSSLPTLDSTRLLATAALQRSLNVAHAV